jgi:mono/diheme cytochrome c family protein
VPRLAHLVLVSLALVVVLIVPTRAAPPVQASLNRSIQQAQSAELFRSHVGPLLRVKCLRCHGEQRLEGGLDLSTRAKLLQGGESGPAIVPGNANKSLLYRLAAHLDEPHMPAGGQQLAAADLDRLARWIDLGAVYAMPLGATPHWAFQPIRRPAVPLPKTIATEGGNVIDHFIRARLEAVGLKPNPEADRRTLIRRLKYDLLGLPPTPEEVDAFLADRSADAYGKLVERYLASPHYGERWGRHWLDVVRFAESHGFEMNQPRPNAWPYRDWVIESLNADLPYDQFVRLQLVGDSGGADAATGFLVAGPWDQVKSPDVALTAQQRADELHDMVSTIGSAFLGLTVGCARCHAHKFDPVSQVDYYRLTAVVAGVQHGERPWRRSDQAAIAAELNQYRDQLAALEAYLATLEPLADPGATVPRRSPVNAKRNIDRFQPVQARYVRFLIQETNQLEPCLDEVEVFTAGPNAVNVAAASAGARVTSSGDYPHAPAIHRLAFIHDGRYGNSRSWISNQMGRGRVEIELANIFEIDRIVWGRDREEKFVDRLPTRYRIDVSTDRQTWWVVASSDDRVAFGTTSATVPPAVTGFQRLIGFAILKQRDELRKRIANLNNEQMVYAGRFTQPEPTFRLHRGDPLQPRERVGPGVLAEIGPQLRIPETASDAERRAALAQWITDPANPLTARVIVNRLWHYHFGTGLVDTPSDLGRNGGQPTHPELLDWLAAELMNPTADRQPRPAWSLKHLHRLIVTSATYRQSAAATPEGLAQDAQSRLLWRYPPRRIEAESLRDAVLFVSGQLDLKRGGPGFDLFEENTNYVKVYTPKQRFGPAEFRRMVYQSKPRMQLDDTFGAFDCPDGGQIAPKRNVSTTPLQALNLLNSPFMLQQAEFMAERIRRQTGPDVSAQVQLAFRLAFQRLPNEREQSAAEVLVRNHNLTALCRAVLNANEFLYVE